MNVREPSSSLSAWRRRTLEEAEVDLFDCEHKTPPPAQQGIPYIAIPQMKEGRLDVSTARLVASRDVPVWNRRVTPKAGDLILSRRTNPGVTAVVPTEFPCVLGQNLVILRSRGTSVDQRFLRWLVRGPEWWQQIQRYLNVGAVFDSLRCADIPRFELTIPPLAEQRAIAHILGKLDDKIELNRRMNETLEGMARALFKSWFVDFDPVRAKAEGRGPGMPQPLADLFPDRLEAKDFYTAPVGWRELHWGDLVTLEYGKSLEGYAGEERPFPVYGTNGRIGSCAKPLCDNPGIIIGRKGAYRGVHWSSDPFFVIDTAFFVKAKVLIELRWAYYELLRRDINSLDSGSAIPSTSRGDFYGLAVLTPPIEIQQLFVRLLSPCWARQEQNATESRTLASLRDTLLPKLISGDLRVPEAAAVLEGTG